MKMQTTLTKLMTVGLLTVGAAGLALADHGGSNPASAKSGAASTQIKLETRLAGAAAAGNGEAEFRSNAAKGRSSLEVEVEHVTLPAATVLNVVLLQGTVSTTIGTITLNAKGSGELELNSQDGALVPAVQKGDSLSIVNGTTAILMGVF